MTNPTPDAALLWARAELAERYADEPDIAASYLAGKMDDLCAELTDCAMGFRAGQSRDAGLLEALKGMVAIQDAMDREGACDGSFIEPRVTAARAAIAAAKGAAWCSSSA